MLPPKVVSIVHGEDKLITIRVISKSTEEPFDLTGATVSVKFAKTDGTTLTKSVGAGVTIVNAVAGKMEVLLSDTDTALLKAGENQDFEAIVTVNTVTSILQFRRALSIFEKIFTT